MSFKLDGTKFKAWSDAGLPLVGGLLYTYVSGTTTNKATYTDSTLGTPNANPVVLDARGEADVWLGTGAYTFVLKTAAGVTIDTVDGISSVDLASTTDPTQGAGAMSFIYSLAYGSGTIGKWLKDNVTRLVDLSATTGANLVGWIHYGVGAVARTLQAKMFDTVSVCDYMTPEQIADARWTPGAFTAALAGSTSGTLTGLWTGDTQINLVTFSDGSMHWAQFTNGSAAVTWGAPVTASASFNVAIGSIDLTSVFTAAQAAASSIEIPPGIYKLDGFVHGNRKVFVGGGLNNTFIRQGSTGNPAWWCVSNATHNPGQVHGAGLTGVWFLGKAGATVSSCIVEATAPQVVAYSNFEFGASGGFHSLEIKTGSAFEVYSSRFHVVQNDWDGRSGGVGSTSTGVITGTGVYNEFYLNVVQCANGIAIDDTSWDCVFRHAVSDGQQIYKGQENTIIGPTVEGWTGTPKDAAIGVIGAANVLINPHIINVPRTSCRGMGIDLNNGGGNPVTITGLRILGQPTALTFTGALAAATSGTLAANWTADATGPYRVQFAYAFTFTGALAAATSGTLSAAWTGATEVCTVTFSDGSTRLCQFTNGATTCAWIGAVTAAANATATITRAVTLTNGAATATWAGAVTAGAAATVIYNVPPVAMQIPPGNSGAITNADVGACPYLLEDAPNTAYFTAVTAETLSRFQFLGDCSTLTRKAGNYADSGSVTFAAATTAPVTFTKMQPNASYRVSFAPQANKTFWVTGKTQQGFTLNASSASSDTVDWTVSR